MEPQTEHHVHCSARRSTSEPPKHAASRAERNRVRMNDWVRTANFGMTHLGAAPEAIAEEIGDANPTVPEIHEV